MAVMTSQAEKANLFLARHRGSTPLLMPNPWDAGRPGCSPPRLRSAGHDERRVRRRRSAGATGRSPGPRRSPTARRSWRRPICPCPPTSRTASPTTPTASPRPCAWRSRPDWPAARSRTSRRAPGTRSTSWRRRATGSRPPRPRRHGGDVHLVLTARAENYLHGRPDLADTIARLQAYQEAGADVLYAPGLTHLEDIRQVVVQRGPAGQRAGPRGRAARSRPGGGRGGAGVGGVGVCQGRARCGGDGGARAQGAGDLRLLGGGRSRLPGHRSCFRAGGLRRRRRRAEATSAPAVRRRPRARRSGGRWPRPRRGRGCRWPPSCAWRTARHR